MSPNSSSAQPRRLRSFRRSLTTRFGLLVLSAIALFALGYLQFGLRPVIQLNADSQFNVACAKVELTLQRTFRPAEDLLQMASHWSRSPGFSVDDPDRFNQLFLPLLSQMSHITSVVAGTDTGEGWMLLQLPDGRWRNRFTDLPRWGKEQRFFEWSAGEPHKEERKIIDYDPRLRPWFKVGLAAEEGHPQWTTAYTFYTTHEPGMTVATHRYLPDGRRLVIGLDIKLADISTTTSTVELGQQGQLLAMTGDEQLLGLPRGSAGHTELLLQAVDQLPIPQLQAGLASWRESGRPAQQILHFESEGRRWLATFKPYALGAQTVWIALFAPASDFLPPLTQFGQALGAILLVVIGSTLLAARRQARRFSAPLEDLVVDSERIARLDFSPGPRLKNRYKEFHRLLQAHDRMRTMLKEYRATVESQAYHLQQALNEKNAILDNALVGIALIKNRQVLQHNRRMAEILGFHGEDLVGRSTERLYLDPESYQAIGQRIFETFNRGEIFAEELWVNTKSGSHIRAHLSGRAIDPAAPMEGSVWVLVDITEQKTAEDRLHYLGHHDPLTGLPNRHLFNDRLEHAILRARREQEQLALLFIDLDHFKVVNDTLGHQIGDQLLCAMTQRLTEHLRSADTLARMGGDEFIILVEDIADTLSLVQVAGKLVEVFATPVELESHQLYMTGSIGISLFPDDGQDAKTLVRNADAAMYQAKAQGRNTYHFYSAEMTQTALRRMELEGFLRQGLKESWLELHFQPQVSLVDSRLLGAEALVRLRHPEKGMIPPLEFISLAEETGLIFPLGQWVIEESCRIWTALAGEGLKLPRLAVNISAKQLQRRDFLAITTATLDSLGMPAGVLELEITESVFLESESALELLSALGNLGILLALDDFGTGYSSLSYLKRLPFSKLKIDKSFIREIGQSPDSETLVRTIINMTSTLGLEVIAEGVESQEQVEFLLSAGCPEAQGYLFAKPLPRDEFEAWMKAQNRLANSAS